MPIKQIYKKDDLFFERHVIFSNNNKIKFSYKKVKKNLVKKIEDLDMISAGKIFEYPIEAISYLKEISKKIKKCDGGLLSFDYGYTNEKNQNTLQSVMKHKYINIFSDPGNADITSLINYKLFNKILKKNNLNVEGVVTQSEFLQKLGIIERANILSKKISFKEKADMFYRLKKLLSRNQMGELFKVLFVQKKKGKFSLGF